MSSSQWTPQLQRENPEPHEGKNPLPGLFLMFFGAVATLGFVYLILYGGSDLAPGGDVRSVQIESEPVERTGEALFAAACASCHQSTGLGIPNAFPPLVGSPWLLDDTETPIRIVLLGLEGEIEVAGQRFNGVMPALGTQLTDAEIARVLTHVRSSWGNDGAPIADTQVREVRASLGARREAWKGGAELNAARAVETP